MAVMNYKMKKTETENYHNERCRKYYSSTPRPKDLARLRQYYAFTDKKELIEIYERDGIDYAILYAKAQKAVKLLP